jgi:hypothetical protein
MKQLIRTKKEILQEYKELYQKWKRIPTLSDLRKNGHLQLAHSIQKKFGGITEVKKRTGLYHKPIEHLSEKEVVNVLKKFCRANSKKLKDFNVFTLLAKEGKHALYKAILKFGGLHRLNSTYQLGLTLKHPGRTEEEILKELKKIQRKGLPITQQSLINIGQSGLLESIKKYGTLTDFKAKLGLPVKKSVRWNKGMIILKYKSLYKKWKQLPTDSMLYNNGHNNLKGAIRRYFGGIVGLRKEIGISSNKKPNHYWTLDATLQELRKFCRTNKTALKKKSVYGMLEKQGLHGLRTAIGNWGGLKRLNKKYNLGLKLQGEKWTRQEVLNELTKLYKKGIPITQKKLNEIGRSDLLVAINKYGTLNKLKEELGMPVCRQNYWTDEKIKDALRPILKEFGSIPSRSILGAMGKNDVARAMAKRGGHSRFCKLLNTHTSNSYVSQDGHFLQSSYECIFDNILFKYKIPHQVHVKISKAHNYRCDFLIGNTYIEIAGYTKKANSKYHDNLQSKIKLYTALKKDYIIIPKETFTKRINEIEKCILLKLDRILPVKSLIKNESIDIRPLVYWADIENIKKELFPLVEKYGRMPLDAELRKEKKSSLITGIYKYHGSYYELGKKLNIPVLNKPKGYHTYENSICIYKELCAKHQRYLTIKELKQMKLHGVIKAIQKNGGIYAKKQDCALKFPNC